MKFVNMFAWMLVCIFAVGLTGCDSKHEETAEASIDLMDEYCDILEDIKTNTDALEAKPKMEKLQAKMKDLEQKQKSDGEPTADEKKKLEEKYKPEMEKVMKRMLAEFERLGKAGVDLSALGGPMGGGPRMPAPEFRMP